VRIGVVGFELERTAIRGHGFGELTPLFERVAQIVVGLREVGLEFERATPRGNSFIEPALRGQCGAQIVMGLCLVRFEFQRTTIRGSGFGGPSRGAAGFAEITMGGGIVWVERDGLANPLDREIVAAGLVSDAAQEVERAGMVWLHGEDLTVERLGVGQSSGAVALEGEIEGLWDGHGGRVGNGKWKMENCAGA